MAGKMAEPTTKQRKLLNECAVLRAVEAGYEDESARARANLVRSMEKAQRAGCSIGIIAWATGLSRSRVQQLLKH